MCSRGAAALSMPRQTDAGTAEIADGFSAISKPAVKEQFSIHFELNKSREPWLIPYGK